MVSLQVIGLGTDSTGRQMWTLTDGRSVAITHSKSSSFRATTDGRATVIQVCLEIEDADFNRLLRDLQDLRSDDCINGT